MEDINSIINEKAKKFNVGLVTFIRKSHDKPIIKGTKLGNGFHGTVYTLIQEKNIKSQKECVKKIKINIKDNELDLFGIHVDYIIKEYKIGNTLTHENFVKLHNIYVYINNNKKELITFYITMNQIDGITMKSTHITNLEKCNSYIKQIGAAYKYLLDNKIYSYDIHSENIMIQYNTLKIVDYGSYDYIIETKILFAYKKIFAVVIDAMFYILISYIYLTKNTILKCIFPLHLRHKFKRFESFSNSLYINILEENFNDLFESLFQNDPNKMIDYIITYTTKSVNLYINILSKIEKYVPKSIFEEYFDLILQIRDESNPFFVEKDTITSISLLGEKYIILKYYNQVLIDYNNIKKFSLKVEKINKHK